MKGYHRLSMLTFDRLLTHPHLQQTNKDKLSAQTTLPHPPTPAQLMRQTIKSRVDRQLFGHRTHPSGRWRHQRNGLEGNPHAPTVWGCFQAKVVGLLSMLPVWLP